MLLFTTFLLMLIVSYAFYQEGLFVAFCNFVNMLLAFVFVVGFYEPSAEFLEIHLKDSLLDGFEDAIAMVGIFLVSFGALKIMALQLAPSVISYQHLVHNLGGPCLGRKNSWVLIHGLQKKLLLPFFLGQTVFGLLQCVNFRKVLLKQIKYSTIALLLSFVISATEEFQQAEKFHRFILAISISTLLKNPSNTLHFTNVLRLASDCKHDIF
jgi:hypothetical protein